MVSHSRPARKLRRELDKELAANAAESGDELSWSAADVVVLERIACAVDRIQDLQRDYAAAGDDVKLRVKLAGEIRLCDGLLSRLLGTVKTDAPVVESRATQRGRRAANIRWGNSARS
jgi:thioredoxin-like negative regulator of GroEL